jgi:hypothetical protein
MAADKLDDARQERRHQSGPAARTGGNGKTIATRNPGALSESLIDAL